MPVPRLSVAGIGVTPGSGDKDPGSPPVVTGAGQGCPGHSICGGKAMVETQNSTAGLRQWRQPLQLFPSRGKARVGREELTKGERRTAGWK